MTRAASSLVHFGRHAVTSQRSRRAMAMGHQFHDVIVADLFDLLVFVDATTPAVQLTLGPK